MVKRRASSGYTLIEAMLVVAIVGILASLGATILLQANRFFLQAKTRTTLQRESRSVMYVVTRELHQAQSATIVIRRVSSSQPYYSRIDFTKEQGTPVTIYQNGNLLCMATNASAFTLAQGGRLVCQTSGGGSATTLSSNLGYLAFTFPRTDDMTIVSVAMTLQQLAYQGQVKALHAASEKVRVMD